MKSELKAGLALLIVTLIWANYPIVFKIALRSTGPFTILFLRFLVATLTLLPFLLKERPWKSKYFSKLLGLSILSTINVVFFTLGIPYTSATVSQLLYATMPLLIILISTIFWHEKYPLRKIIGVIIGLSGILFIIYLSILQKGTTIAGSFVGNVAILVGVISWMFYIIFSKKLSNHFSPIAISAVTVIPSFGASIILFFFEKSIYSNTFILNNDLILASIYLGFFATTLAYILYQYGIKNSSALTVSLTFYIQPIFTAIFATIILGEYLTFSFLIGCLLVFIGIFITTFLEIHHRRKR